MIRIPRSAAHRLASAAIALFIAGCASGSPDSQPPTAEPVGYSAIIASTEFVVGENRFPFGLVSDDGTPLENADVAVRFYFLTEDAEELRSEVQAGFHRIEGITPHQHEDGQLHEHVEVRGVYIVDRTNFDAAGFWGAGFVATTADGQRIEIPQRAFEVKDKSVVPNVGDPVPASRNLTLADVDNIEEIETRIPPDGMHHLSVAEALEIGKPFVVVFATPLYCVTRMCGPVTDIAAALQERYQEQVNFIHIEPWDLKIARSEGRLVPIDIVSEWNLPTEPWVFVVDRDGRVAARFEGLVTSEELEKAIASVIVTPAAQPAPATVEPTGVARGSSQDGAALYAANCQACHGDREGRGVTGGAPPHNESGHTWHHPDAQLKDWVLNGKLGLIGPPMPAFGAQLKEPEVDAILEFIKSWWTPDQRETQADVSRRYQEALDKQQESR